jgi:uncharacterized protein
VDQVKSLTLEVLTGNYAIYRFAPDSSIPDWVLSIKGFSSITRTSDELSVVCESQNLELEGVKQDSGWTCLKLIGPFAFDLTGILSSVLNPLRDAKIGIFAISTFDTDYVLVKLENLERAVLTLENAGHSIKN